MKRRIALLSLGAATIVAACASTGSPAPETDTRHAAEALQCTIAVPEAGNELWREVRAKGFTFCVPVSWRPAGRPSEDADARTWRGDGGTVTWGTGPFRPRRVVSTVEIVRAGDPLPPLRQPQRFTEVIGGRPADLWINEIQGKHYTGVTWAVPGVYLEGEANNAATARLQLGMYRTVRFVEP